MTRSRILGCAVLTLVALIAAPSVAQLKDKPGKTLMPMPITLTGTVVDLHNYMTEQWLSTDHAQCTADCIRAGVPAALETKDGLYLLASRTHNSIAELLPFAFRTAEVTGKLYEKHNIRYVDFTSINPGTAPKVEKKDDFMSDYDD